jgi:hypothetical protein
LLVLPFKEQTRQKKGNSVTTGVTMKTTEKFSKRIRPVLTEKDLIGTTPKNEQTIARRGSLKPMKSMVGIKSSRPVSLTGKMLRKKMR